MTGTRVATVGTRTLGGKMARSHTQNPSERMGVYKRLEDVPDHYRLYHQADAYHGRDVWEEYLTTHLFDDRSSDEVPREKRRFGERWKGHMDGRHHALATPGDVADWSAVLNEEYAPITAVHYWTTIERFYWWLLEHTDHPHVYHPFLMAADTDDETRAIWNTKVKHARGDL